MERWAADHQQKVENLELQRREDQRRMAGLEQRLNQAQNELLQVATAVPRPTTLAARAPTEPRTALGQVGEPVTQLTLGSPLLGRIQRQQRPPAIPADNGGAGGNGAPPRPPRRVAPPSPSPPSDEVDGDLYEWNLPMGRGPPNKEEPTHERLATMLTPEEIARLVGAGIAAARIPAQPQIRTSRLKMENPAKLDWKNPTAFNQWWESVTMYLGFYPETIDRQKIAWVGTLLTDTALVWHLHQHHKLRDNDTWANYSAAIRAEYRNEREAADAQLTLGQLKYHGDIRSYMTEFRALNLYARATGESLQEMVNLAMPESVMDMRFTHYLEDFADDKGFLQATYQAALQVEKKKALRLAREQAKTPVPTGKRDKKKKDGPSKEGSNGNRKKGETEREPQQEGSRGSDYGGAGQWASEAAAFKGVPDHERREYASTRGCHHC